MFNLVSKVSRNYPFLPGRALKHLLVQILKYVFYIQFKISVQTVFSILRISREKKAHSFKTE